MGRRRSAVSDDIGGRFLTAVKLHQFNVKTVVVLKVLDEIGVVRIEAGLALKHAAGIVLGHVIVLVEQILCRHVHVLLADFRVKIKNHCPPKTKVIIMPNLLEPLLN